MSEFTDAKLEEAIGKAKEAFADGFQITDIATVIKTGIEFAEIFKDLTGEEKKALALRYIEKVMQETDVPWWPDTLYLPFIGDIGADALVMRFAPKIIDIIVGATKGNLAVNK